MKIVHITQYDVKGFIESAAYKIHKSLIKAGFESRMLVIEKNTTDQNITKIKTNALINSIQNNLNNRLCKPEIIPDSSFSFGIFGIDISGHSLVRNADIIHLHQMSEKPFGVETIQKIIRLKKKIVWTLQNSWAFTGGCHYTGACENFKIECKNCPQLDFPGENDVSFKIFTKKAGFLQNAHMCVICSSDALRNRVQESALLKKQIITTIQNPVDTSIFRQSVRMQGKKKYILYGGEIHHTSGGWNDFLSSITFFEQSQPELSSFCEVIILSDQEIPSIPHIKMKINSAGIVTNTNQLAGILTMCSIFVLPLIEENTNTILLEALSCGLPSVTFNVNGINEIIIHKENGYSAQFKNNTDLAAGIEWCLNNRETAGKNAIERMNKINKDEIVSSLYIETYKGI